MAYKFPNRATTINITEEYFESYLQALRDILPRGIRYDVAKFFARPIKKVYVKKEEDKESVLKHLENVHGKDYRIEVEVE
jgi:hypothetical protein